MTAVKATRRGFYGSLREVGEPFTVSDDKHLSARWMERKDGKPIKAKAKAAAKVEAPKDDTPDPLAALLAGNVPDVIGRLDGLSDDELVKLAALEEAGGKRKGVASAIADARAKLAEGEGSEGDTGDGAGDGSSEAGSNDSSGSDAGDAGNPDG